MHSETQINLAEHRLETANEKLQASELLLNGGLYKDSIGRSHYAIFSATRAVLALDSKDFPSTQELSIVFKRIMLKKVFSINSIQKY